MPIFSFWVFDVLDFTSAIPKGWKKINWISTCRILCWTLRKKILKKLNILEAPQTLKIFGVAISSHVISFWFLLISGNFQATQVNQSRFIWSWKVSCNWEKTVFWLSQKERFLEPIEKNSYFVIITGEPVSATISLAQLWWSRRLLYFLFFILLQFCYW